MRNKLRVPITAITVFGASSLLAITVAIVLYLGFNQAAKSTRQLLADKSDTLINAMEQSLEFQLRPIRDQALWVAKDIHDLSSLAAFDDTIFGALAATPQVEGIAIVKADGSSRRWHRKTRQVIQEDWSNRGEIVEWLETVKTQREPAWRAPIWVEQPVTRTTLLHDISLVDHSGKFIGVFAQIVPVSDLSNFLSINYAETGLTPFVLYDKNYVLVHPMLINSQLFSAQQQPLPTFEVLGDLVLSRIWTPDVPDAYISEAMVNTRASGVFFGDDFYLYIHRDINRYGAAPWTVGAYINTSLHDDQTFEPLVRALVAGITVLVIAIIASILVGRNVSKPIKAIVEAARLVESGRLDSVPQLAESRIGELDDAGNAFNNMVQGLKERNLIRATLGRFVPEKVAGTLLAGGGQIQPQQVEATILFCDIEAFTRLTESLGPIKIVEVLNAYFSAMTLILEKHDGVITQFQGDAILATFNVPVANPEHATNAVRAAQEMLAKVATARFADEVLNIRVGINTGPVVAGAIGAEGRLSYTVHGDAVNLAARLESLNKEYGTRLLLSDYTTHLVQDYEFTQVCETSVRGQSKAQSLYTLNTLLPE